MSTFKPEYDPVNGSPYSFGIVCSRFNPEAVDALLENTLKTLKESGVLKEKIHVMRVPGSNEIPWGIQMLASTGSFDCCIALGVLLRGGTVHFEIVAQSASDGLQMISLNEMTPVINGIVVADTVEQAIERTKGEINRGLEFGEAALQMALLKKEHIFIDEQNA
ncbi:MAG: 6,7-dimethyl-8-ribityllumazine synthase [Opitutaceae bacterium]|nr:6,7-dimethyl-8-ribityllumazine synthase [Opitutaceae bacterium]|tara:strand:+ start:20495 stop:20986 length:492 start_codon:yes stop_codon:yes gene_type:complete